MKYKCKKDKVLIYNCFRISVFRLPSDGSVRLRCVSESTSDPIRRTRPRIVRDHKTDTRDHATCTALNDHGHRLFIINRCHLLLYGERGLCPAEGCHRLNPSI